LYSHLASKILAIQPNEWETAVFLPTHQFQNAKANKVWKESVAQIKGQSLHTQVVGEKRENIE